MDRLTTGRRHIRAGSVSVTELITKLDVPPVSSPEPDVPEPMAEPVSHRQPPSRAAQVVKMVSLGFATAALCGAVAAASMITDEHRAATTPASRPDTQITGVQALLPDQLNQTLAAAGCATCARPGAPPVEPPAPAPNANGVLTDQKATPAADGTSPTASDADSAGGSAVAPPSDLDLVREFYESLPTSPAHAFGLLSPEMIGTSAGEFLNSWATVSSIEIVDITQRADGVLAVVRMQLTDGSQLRIQQLLRVAESPRRIVGVELLSAQRY